jgi:flavorubredoxin
MPVKDGESLSLGNLSVSFVETRMVHWPDSMFTYLADGNLLFSQDGFGMHLATSRLFADENDQGVVDYETAKYYANILLPLSPIVGKVLDKVESLGIRPRVIAPDHGPIWRGPEDIQKVVALYRKWAEQKPARKAVVVYDTMWQSTALMARAIVDGLRVGGAEAKLLPMSGSDRSDVATEILDAGALLVGSPTINNTMFPTVADVLTYLKGLKRRNLIGAAFGSYGWAGGATKEVEAILRDMKVELVSEALLVKYVPTGQDLDRCFDLGVRVARQLEEICGEG